MSAGGGQGLQQLQHQQSVAAISVCLYHDRCTLGSKENSHTCISSLCLYLLPLGYPLPVLREHLGLLSDCVTS